MSKIRNLFSKIKSKVKKSEDTDDDEYIEINVGAEDDIDDDIDSEIDDEIDEDQALETESQEPIYATDDEDKTGEIEVNIPDDSDLEFPDTPSTSSPEISMQDEDKTGEIPIMQDEDKTGDIPVLQSSTEDISEEDDESDDDLEDETIEALDEDIEEDYDEAPVYANEEFTSSEIDEDAIDLDNSQLSFKDKAQMFFQKIKDKANRFNRKKFQQLTIDDSKKVDEDKAIIGKNRKKVNDVLSTAKTRLAKIDYKNIHREFFSYKNQNIIHKTFQLAMILTSVFLVGKYTALLIKGADKDAGFSAAQIKIDETRNLNKDDIDEIKVAKVFKTEAVKKVPTDKKPINTVAKCEKATRKSSLPITLINTIVLQDSVKSIASVQLRSGKKPSSLREGDKIQGMAQLSKIDRMKIIIKNLSSGLCEYVEADKKGSRRPRSPIAVMNPSQSRSYTKRQEKIDGIENEGNDFTIEKTFLQDKLKDINSILTQARGIQLTNPDGSLSFKIVEIQPGSVFSYLGIENNDIITEIGGKKINDLNQVMSLFGSLQGLDKLNLKVKRNGEEVPLNYKFR